MSLEAGTTSLGRKIATGAIWMMLFKFADRSIGLISTMILARLLLPQDFGLVAMAMSIIGVLELLGYFNFDLVLIQNQDAERHHYDTAWTFDVLFGIVSTGILMLLAVPAAHFYAEPRLEMVMYFLAAGQLIQGLENVGVVQFRKELQFDREFRFMLAKKMAGFVVVVPLAFILKSYWALIIGMLASRFFGVTLSYFIHPYRPWFSMRAAHELFHFSKWLLLNNILSFLRMRVGDFIIGKISGTRTLGLYTVAYEISNLPTTELVGAISRAIFPGYAKMASDMDILRQGIISVCSIIVLFALPAGVGVAMTAGPLVKVFLGAKWVDAIPLIQILSFYGIAFALQTNISYVYMALGKPSISAALSGAYLLVLIPVAIWSALKAGVTGAAWGYLGTALLFLPITFILLFNKLSIRPMRFFAEIWRPVVATCVMAGVLESCKGWLEFAPGVAGNILELGLTAGLGLIIYCMTIFYLWRLCSQPRGPEQIILDRFAPGLGLKPA